MQHDNATQYDYDKGLNCRPIHHIAWLKINYVVAKLQDLNDS